MVLEGLAVEPGRVDHHHIGPGADLQAPGVEAVEVRQLAGELVHGLLGGEERRALELCLVHALEQTDPEVVERHVPQVRAGIGETDRHARGPRQPVGDLLPRVGDGGGPAEVGAVLHHQVEVGVRRVELPGARDVADGLADQ